MILFDVKQLQMNKFKSSIWQVIISTSNATLEVPLLRFWEEHNQKFVIVTIDKASNNFAFLCRKYYISKLLTEIFLNKNGRCN